jgi:endonuclease/exonuclease/phosphatase family metal-dependent hydrolase
LKKLLNLFLSVLFASVIYSQDLQVMTFNIRYNNPGDSLNAWPLRKDILASQVLFHEVQLLGVQEALHGQIVDLKERLPNFKTIGIGRDGGEKGEYSAIFYDSTRLQALGSATFWLSLTPEW